MRMPRIFAYLLLIAAVSIGCSEPQNENAASDTEATTTQPQASNGAASPKAAPADPPIAVEDVRTDMQGRWVLVLTQQATDFPITLLEFDKSDANQEFQGQQLDTSEFLPNPELQSATVDGDSVAMEFSVRDATFDFEGRFSDGLVRGNVLFDGGMMNTAWLRPTNLESISGQDVSETKGKEEFTKAFESNEPIEALREYARTHAESPLALDALQQVFDYAKEESLDAATVDEVAEQYIAAAAEWGGRMKILAAMNVGLTLAQDQYLPEVAVRYLDQAESQVGDEFPDEMRTGIQRAKQLLTLSTGDAEAKSQAAASLEQVQNDNPFDHQLMLALAEYYQAEGETEKALSQYARLAVLPTLEQRVNQQSLEQGVEKPLPSESVAALWKELHEDTEGLEAYLDKTYRETLTSFASEIEPSQQSAENNQTALVELFTGAACPPCVAADVATSALEQIYPTSELIVVRYHEHVAGPDPLANEATEARYDYYSPRGTPTVVLNGETLGPVGGPLSFASVRLKEIHPQIETAVSKQSEVELDLSANAENGELSISAAAKNFGNAGGALRLRLILAEEEIEFVAPNGIRLHEMVVRSMPGGAGGVGLTDGQLEFKQTIGLAELKKQVADYLAAFEQGIGRDFTVKPLAMEKLHFVAFLQNDETKEILQAGAIPVSGEITYPENLQAANSNDADQQPPAASEDSANGEVTGDAAAGSEESPNEG